MEEPVSLYLLDRFENQIHFPEGPGTTNFQIVLFFIYRAVLCLENFLNLFDKAIFVLLY